MRIRFHGWQFHIGLTHSQEMIGVNSNLVNGKHFIMWDFDGHDVDKVIPALNMIQKAYTLPTIYILNTGTWYHYHAYCFHSVSWTKLVTILLNTPMLDKGFLQIGFLRGYYTLRISPKNEKYVRLAYTLESTVTETVDKMSIPRVIKYWTKRV